MPPAYSIEALGTAMEDEKRAAEEKQLEVRSEERRLEEMGRRLLGEVTSPGGSGTRSVREGDRHGGETTRVGGLDLTPHDHPFAREGQSGNNG